MTGSRPRTKLTGVKPNRPCEVCGRTTRCSKGEDESYQCRDRPDPAPSGFVLLHKGDEFNLYRRQDDPVLRERDEEFRRSGGSVFRQRATGSTTQSPNGDGNGNGYHHNDDRRSTENTDGGSADDVAALVVKCAANLTPERQAALADALGLPAWTLDAIEGLGYSPEGLHPGHSRTGPEWPCWTFPECDAAGRIIGLSARYADGKKLTRGRRGLTLPTDWRNRGGDVLLVEGGSDSAAGTALGLAVVGRPFNTGGVDHLVALLADLPDDRNIVFVGETDPKEDGRWPGKEGAISGAEKLAAKLNRPVQWALAPGGRKDSRDWVNAQALPPDCLDAWQEAGPRFVSALKRHTIKPTPKTGFAWDPIGSTEFACRDYRPTWLVKRMLVKDQPAIVGGPKKSLKTSALVDLAVSLASGTPFLGEFTIYKPVRVAMLSGESGAFTLQETGRRICQARDLDLGNLGDNLVWQFALPQLSNAEHLAALRKGLADSRAEVAILDPLYLSLLAGGAPGGARAENLYEMGPLLFAVTQTCLDVGATPILAHHTRKGAGREDGGKKARPLDLDDLAFSGIAEFARQWMLISRREPYEPGTGLHELWLSVGGSTGQGGLWAVNVNEGTLAEDFTGRTWDVMVASAPEARKAEGDEKEQAKTEKRNKQDKTDDTDLLAALDKLDPDKLGVTYERVKIESRLTVPRMSRAFERLIRDGIVERITVEAIVGNKAKRTAVGIRRPTPEGQQTDLV